MAVLWPFTNCHRAPDTPEGTPRIRDRARLVARREALMPGCPVLSSYTPTGPPERSKYGIHSLRFSKRKLPPRSEHGGGEICVAIRECTSIGTRALPRVLSC